MKRTFAAMLLLLLATPASGQDYELQVLTHLERKGVRFYDHADKLSGIPSCLKVMLGGIEPIGRIADAREIMSIQQDFEWFHRISSSVLAFAILGVRLDDAKDKETIRDFGETLPRGGCLTAPNTLQEQMVGMDDWLRWQEAYYKETVEKEDNVRGDRYKDLLDRLNGIRKIRAIMGAPPLVTTEDEFWATISERGLGPDDFVRAKGKFLRVRSLIKALNEVASEEAAAAGAK